MRFYVYAYNKAMTNMILRKKHLFLRVLAISILVFVTLLTPLSSVHATEPGKNEVCEGLGGCEDRGTSDLRIAGVVQAALNIVSIVIGIAGVIMVMLGGFRYITAGGDSGKISSAQNTILWALVGLVVAATAQIIVRFVLARI
jgi:hypothetical protein